MQHGRHKRTSEMYQEVFQEREVDQVIYVGLSMLQCYLRVIQTHHHPRPRLMNTATIRNMFLIITTINGIVYLFLIIKVLHLGRVNHMWLFRLCSLRTPCTIPIRPLSISLFGICAFCLARLTLFVIASLPDISLDGSIGCPWSGSDCWNKMCLTYITFRVLMITRY